MIKSITYEFKGDYSQVFLAQKKDLNLVKIPIKKLEILAKIQSYIMGNDEWGKVNKLLIF